MSMKNNLKVSHVTYITYLGMMIAVAMILSYVESLVPFYFGAPGIKLGLANFVMVFMIYQQNAKEALLINFLRIILVGFLFGNMSSILYSLAGGLLSFIVMYLSKKMHIFGICGVSILGGISHNMGQLVVAMFVVRTFGVAYYLPVLLIGGLITGLLIGIVTEEILKRIPKRGTQSL
ncbi:MAG: Gx transporter family protein [Lachnospiraceae bacterium]|nr:Gx transporter family protein [Lachnospiraceae bacterium]